MDFWKKLVQISQKVLGKEIKNPHELDKKLLGAFGAYIDLVEEVNSDLASALLRYIIDDDDETCLLTLSADADACYRLNVSAQYGNAPQVRSAILDADHKAPPEVWVRYGKMLAAASKIRGAYVHNAEPDKIPNWLLLLISEISTRYSESVGKDNRRAPWSLDELERIIVTGELSADILIEPLLSRSWTHMFRSYNEQSNLLRGFTGVDFYFKRHLDGVRTVLLQSTADDRIYALEILESYSFDFSTVTDLLVQFGTGSSKTLREATLKLLNANRENFRPAIETVLKTGSATERHEAISLLWRLYGADCSESLEQHLLTEKAPRVRQTIEKYLSTPTAPSEEESTEMPAVQVQLDPVAIPNELKKIIQEVLVATSQAVGKQYEQQLAAWNEPKRPKWMQKPVKTEPATQKDIDKIIAFIEGREKTDPSDLQIIRYLYLTKVSIGDCLIPPGVTLEHVVRLMFVFKFIQFQKYTNLERVWMYNQPLLDAYRARCQFSFGLRELDAVAATLPGFRPGLITNSYLIGNAWGAFCDWEADAIWPAFAERGELIDQVLISNSSASHYGSRKTAFNVLRMFPTLPSRYIPLLWDLALGEAKSERRDAQDALNTVAGKTEKIIGSLSDGKQSVRCAAAEWLGRLGDTSSIDPLKQAFHKEKNEIAKGVMIHALDLLNADVDEFLNRDKLLKEAHDGLSKKFPKGMEWFPLENLPTLHWQDNGNAVDAEIVKWWVVQSVQQKSPICGPILKRYLGMCREAESAKLAKFVLQSWLSRDTTTATHEEASEKARADADKQWAAYGNQQWFSDAYKGDKENVYKAFYSNIMGTCLYSAIDQKGLLAVVSASGDGDCVKLAEQYIRKWYGQRVAQCKALVDVLAWLPHPLALQTLLSLANRFRTKSIKELAAVHVTAVAERRGWTIDELADRTIPEAGFERPLDEDGKPIDCQATLEIDFGPRQFVVSLNDQLETVIFAKGESKPLKALPAPAKSDDPELAKAGKKEFADAKKIAKEVVKRQTERLYEALCTQRSWKFEDWQLYLGKHPIVGRLCVRLIWVVYANAEQGDGDLLGAFRPLEDGSLTNEQDEQVIFPADATVKLAHSCNMSSELRAAWTKHFEDYDVTPLFPQCNRPVYVIPEEKLKNSDVVDFVGHLITTFKLRNRAVKLGYVRGETEDGGCFYVYKKTFSSLEMQAHLEFTGSYLPEEDRPAALKELYFVSTAGKGNEYSWNAVKIPLSKVPPVLLSECYNDVKQIAADGSGFDSKWQEKSYF